MKEILYNVKLRVYVGPAAPAIPVLAFQQENYCTRWKSENVFPFFSLYNAVGWSTC